MDLFRLVSLVVYSTGALAYGAVLVAWFARPALPAGAAGREPESPGEAQMDLALSVTSFAWFVVNALLTLAEAVPALGGRSLVVVFVVLAFLFPPLIAQAVYFGARAKPGAQPSWWWRLGPAAIWVVSVVAMGRVIAEAMGPQPLRLGMAIGVLSTSLYVATGIYSVAVLQAPRSERETPDETGERRMYVGLFLLLVTGFLVASAGLAGVGSRALAEVASLITRALPLVFLFAATWYGDRFTFVDLFLKRGLALVVSLLALTLALALLLPVLDTLALAWARPWVLALGLLPAVALAQWLRRRLDAWLDAAWLGRRHSVVQAIGAFLEAVHDATSEGDLVAKAEASLGVVFHARVDVCLDEDPPAGGPHVPIRSRGAAIGALALGPRANRQPYFSGDLALAAALGAVLGPLVENVRLQARQQEARALAQRLALEASRSELKALRAQINPHFLFNALNAIGGLLRDDPDRADRTVEQLAEVFRYALRRSEAEWARVDEEAAFARAYLDVERARFGERLAVDVTVAPGAGPLQVPALLLQTLVENAVKHGAAALRGPARVAIDARVEHGQLVLAVSDSGPGFDPAAEPRAGGTGYGLRHVRERLRAHFGDAARLSIARDESRGLTTVALHLPATSGQPASIAAAAAPGDRA